MSKAQVAIARATDYRETTLRAAVDDALGRLGGLPSIVPPGANVFVKINHLSPPSEAERAIVTHPAFTEVVVELLKPLAGSIIVGDDITAASDGFALSGYRAMAERTGVELLNLRQRGFEEVPCGGVVLKAVLVAAAVLEADVIVNLPKLKTHSLTLLTGAVKNMYGVIPAGRRTAYHGMHNREDDFADLLVDVFSAVPPQLNIMDGVVAMEGNGPADGRPRPAGLILASRDAVAMDAVAGHAIGLHPESVRTTRRAHARGLGLGDLEQIELLGSEYDDIRLPGFGLPASAPSRLVGRLPRPLAQMFTQQLAAWPRILAAACVGCGACAQICPVSAATMRGDRAHIQRDRCIRCMCCHEVCRYGAIVLKRSWSGRGIAAAMRAGRRLALRG